MRVEINTSSSTCTAHQIGKGVAFLYQGSAYMAFEMYSECPGYSGPVIPPGYVTAVNLKLGTMRLIPRNGRCEVMKAKVTLEAHTWGDR